MELRYHFIPLSYKRNEHWIQDATLKASHCCQLCIRCCLVSQLCPALWWPHGLQSAWFLCPWDFPGKNPGVGCHVLLQGIFRTQGSNLHLLHHRWILYHWATWEAPQKIVVNTLPRASYPLSIGKEYSNLAFNLWIDSMRFLLYR